LSVSLPQECLALLVNRCNVMSFRLVVAAGIFSRTSWLGKWTRTRTVAVAVTVTVTVTAPLPEEESQWKNLRERCSCTVGNPALPVGMLLLHRPTLIGCGKPAPPNLHRHRCDGSSSGVTFAFRLQLAAFSTSESFPAYIGHLKALQSTLRIVFRQFLRLKRCQCCSVVHRPDTCCVSDEKDRR
jgi:hypothetical protein